MTVISITLPYELLARLDALVRERGYYSRSEAIRDAIRSMLAEAELAKVEGGLIAAVILVASDLMRKDVDSKLVEIRSEYEDIVTENLHQRIGNEYCIDVFLALGERKRIAAFVGRIRGTRGVRDVKVVFLPIKQPNPLLV